MSKRRTIRGVAGVLVACGFLCYQQGFAAEQAGKRTSARTLGDILAPCFDAPSPELVIEALPPAASPIAPLTPENVEEFSRTFGWEYIVRVRAPGDLARLRSRTGADRLVRMPSTAFIDVKVRLRCDSGNGQSVELLVDSSGRFSADDSRFRLESGRNWIKEFLMTLALLEFP